VEQASTGMPLYAKLVDKAEMFHWSNIGFSHNSWYL
jgi:hypothetical protein